MIAKQEATKSTKVSVMLTRPSAKTKETKHINFIDFLHIINSPFKKEEIMIFVLWLTHQNTAVFDKQTAQ